MRHVPFKLSHRSVSATFGALAVCDERSLSMVKENIWLDELPSLNGSSDERIQPLETWHAAFSHRF